MSRGKRRRWRRRAGHEREAGKENRKGERRQVNRRCGRRWKKELSTVTVEKIWTK